MSRTYVFVGPYLTLQPVERDREYRTRACSAHATSHPAPSAAARFCSTCGAPIAETTTTKRELTGLWPTHLPDEFTDWMWMPEALCLMSNAAVATVWLPNHRGYSLDLHEGDEPVELTLALIHDYLNRFQTHYKKLLDYLEATYPGASSVKFGTLAYGY